MTAFSNLPHGAKEALVARLAAGKAKAKASRASSTAPPSAAPRPKGTGKPLRADVPTASIPKPASNSGIHVHIHLPSDIAKDGS